MTVKHIYGVLVTGVPKKSSPKAPKDKKDKRPRNKILLNINEAPSFSPNKLLKYWDLQSTQAQVMAPPKAALITFQAPAGFHQHSKASNPIAATQEGQAPSVGMGITPQHHRSPRMSPEPGTRCWEDTRSHSLPSTAPRGAAGPGQSQGKELNGSSADLPWGSLEEALSPYKQFQGVFHALGQEGAGSSQRHLGWDSAPSVALLLLSHQESWDPSFLP